MTNQRATRNQSVSMDSILAEYNVDGVLRFKGKVWDKSDTGVKILVNDPNLFLKSGTWGILTLIEKDKKIEYWGETVWIERMFASNSYWVGMRILKK